MSVVQRLLAALGWADAPAAPLVSESGLPSVLPRQAEPLGTLGALPAAVAPAWSVPAAPPELRTLRQADYAQAARDLGIELAVLMAVAEVESRGSGFLADGRPVVLFEAHVFDRLTRGRFRGRVDRNGVALSVARWDRGLYGRAGAHQHDRLADAAALDADAAIQACSWGQFQVMGQHWRMMETGSPRGFMGWMGQGAGAHLMSFARYVRATGLTDELQRRDWAGFARGYNGPRFAANQYDRKMAAAYARLIGGALAG